ncbi:RNA polymerase sigma-70 factor [Mucilaginibacter sp. PAMB04168]|uniref:RNA polymerase sigma-70 factor n=1 Tax=Mucilaginibacter sp. PAMB04168 TaxID=3138567 RepID=UPI0031F6A699
MSQFNKLSDYNLISLLREDDDAAFKEIYDRYNSLLYIYAYRKLRDKEEARDVVQEVFTTLWTNRCSLIIQTTLSGYLYRAVLNKVLNIFRHKGFCDAYADQLQSMMSANSTTDYLIREKEIAGLIEKEITSMPPRMREVFELRRKEFLTNKEIADRLSISEHTVSTQMKKALRVLRVRFGVVSAFLYLIFG